MSIQAIIGVFQILIWVLSPTFTYAQGKIFEKHIGLEELVAEANVANAVSGIDIDDLQVLDEADFTQFIGSHINMDAQDDPDHVHSTLDSCCGAGGIVCDASIVSIGAVEIPGTHQRMVEGAIYSPVSMSTMPLRRPPKPYSHSTVF